MQYKYLFSVIVPTYNRVDEIKELLQSLTKQILPKEKFEVIIVDDGSTDNTLEYLAQYQNESGVNLRVLKQVHKGPGEARNLGMANADGKYMLFIDSDCIADPNWLQAYSDAVSVQDAAGFGGPDAVLDSFSPVQKAIDYSMTSFITTGGIRGHSKKKISKYYPRSFNMGIRHDVYDKIGGMNKLRHGQDIEFSHRIISVGEPVIKVDGAVVYHKRRMSIRKFFRQVYNWGAARINLYKIDKKMLELVHMIPPFAVILSGLIIILAIVFPYIFLPVIAAGIFILILMAIHGIFKYNDARVFWYIPVIVPTQIIGYGLGFINGFIRRIIFGQGEYTGFVKKYYK